MTTSPGVPRRAQLDCPRPWSSPVTAALASAGVRVEPDAPLGIAFAPGRTVSPTIDDWTVASLPHVLVSVRPHAVEVGPWAAPGVGPCARCVAAAVLDEGGRVTDDLPLPLPLVALAAGTVARDLVAWARGETPHTWLTSWRHDHDPLPGARRWQRHPYCGCGWFDSE